MYTHGDKKSNQCFHIHVSMSLLPCIVSDTTLFMYRVACNYVFVCVCVSVCVCVCVCIFVGGEEREREKKNNEHGWKCIPL